MARYQSPSSRFMNGTSSQIVERSQYADPTHAQASRPAHNARDHQMPKLKCSTCALWLEVEDVASHTCDVNRAEETRRKRQPPEQLRVDVQAAGNRAGSSYGYNLAVNTPDSACQSRDHSYRPLGSANDYLTRIGSLGTPSTTTSSQRARSPSKDLYTNTDLARSASSLSSASSSSKMPFLEKYSQLVGNGNVAGLGSGMPRSTASRDISASGSLPSSRSLPLDSASFHEQSSQLSSRHAPRPTDSGRYGDSLGEPSPQYSQVSFASRSPSARSFAMNESSDTSRRSPNPGYANRGEREDNRQTMKASQSSPAKLDTFATPNAALQPPRSRGATSSAPRSNNGSAADLEACMNDLRLMTEGQGVPDDEPQSALDPQRIDERAVSPQRTRSSRCTTCDKTLHDQDMQRSGDGQLFCRECYAQRYLPKCRKCSKAIEGGAVTSSDGKVSGKVSKIACRYCYAIGSLISVHSQYHPACFSCWKCSIAFPTGEFYVL